MMFKSHLLWRLFAGYVAIILVSMLIVGVLVGRQVTESGAAEIQHSLAVRSALLAKIAMPVLRNPLSEQKESLQKMIVQLGKDTDSRLTVIAIDGAVIADSQELPENMDNHGQRPEIIDALDRDFATASRFSQTLQKQMIYRALRVTEDQKTIGFVRVSLPLSMIDSKLAQLRLIILFGTGVSALATLLLGFYFAKRFSDPLIRMTATAEAISRGDYNRRVSVQQQDEIGKLASAINRMARSAAHRMTEITSERNRLAMIFAGMVEGVIAVDQDQKIIHINRAAADLLGLSMTACINQPVWTEVRVQEINEALQQAMDTRDVINTQMRKPSVAADLVVDIYAAELRNEDGDPIGAVVVLHDISELDNLERIRRDFVANASHELKTPITAIRGLTETILDDEDMNTDTRTRFTEKIHTQSLRLSSLVTDLMIISRLESDQIEQHFQAINFSELAQRSITAARSVCQEKQLVLKFKSANDQIMIDGDMQAISQMIDNLLDNAIKYTPAGGEISIILREHQDYVQFTVKDTGIGISPQYQQRIFERFYRVEKARSRELGGTGLGLSIVKNIAEQHGGKISVASQLGNGATFEVLLPVLRSGVSESSL